MYFNSGVTTDYWRVKRTGIKTESFNIKKLEVGTMQGHEEKVHNNRSLLEQVGRRKGTPDPEFSHNELCIMQFQQTKHNTALQAKFSNYNTHSSH